MYAPPPPPSWRLNIFCWEGVRNSCFGGGGNFVVGGGGLHDFEVKIKIA